MATFATLFAHGWAVLQAMHGEAANWTYRKADGSTFSVDVIVTDSDAGPDRVSLSVLYQAADVTSPNREGDRFEDPDGLFWRIEHVDFNRNGINRARAARARERP